MAITFDSTSFTCSAGARRFTGGKGFDIEMLKPFSALPTAAAAVVGDAPMNVAITAGVELDCDLNPPNNLEINWSGHHFHMLDFLSAVCLDDPTIHQQPPAAPLSTMIGVGTGRYDGSTVIR